MIKGTPSFCDQRISAHPRSQWTAALAPDLRAGRVLAHELETELPVEIRHTPLGVWLLCSVSHRLKVGLRVPCDPAGLSSLRVLRSTPGGLEIAGRSGTGGFHVRIAVVAGSATMIRCTTTLTPRSTLQLENSKRDVCVFDGRFEPWAEGARLLTAQTGNTVPQVFLEVPGDPGATIFYFQNLTALSRYFMRTRANAADSVSVRWPEAGFALPSGERALAANVSVVIQDSFIEVRRGVPANEASAAEMFLCALAKVYPLIGRPEPEYYDWPAAAQRTLRSLNAKTGCCRKVNGKLYVQAYVACDKKPPESMVQGALIVPLMEYEAWRRRALPLLTKLAHTPTSFYDENLRVPVRWLSGADFKNTERSEEEHHFLMDSWYLLHTLLNLGRMAELGHPVARTVFLDSMAALIRAAHRFDYDWPVFYDQRTLKIRKRETEDGQGGEQDAAGLYAHVMLQAYEFTQERKYLDEAEASARRLKGLAFGILYQTNATAISSVALARLWRLTGKSVYRDLSTVSVASIMSHLWLWHLGPETKTFMALPPLHNAPYVAFYEEGEVLATLETWHKIMGDKAPEGVALLLAEYQQHLLARGRFYFPSELSPELIEPSPKELPIHARLPIPLEGLGAPKDKAGSVGQAVYGAGAAFVLAARCWHRPRSAPFAVFCGYPVTQLEEDGTRRRGKLRLDISGSSKLSCMLRLLPGAHARVAFDLVCNGRRHRWSATGKAGWCAKVPGGAQIEISWRDRAKSLSGSRSP